jgi:hypothetical protein
LPHVYSRGGAADIRKHEPVLRSSLLRSEEEDDTLSRSCCCYRRHQAARRQRRTSTGEDTEQRASTGEDTRRSPRVPRLRLPTRPILPRRAGELQGTTTTSQSCSGWQRMSVRSSASRGRRDPPSLPSHAEDARRGSRMRLWCCSQQSMPRFG